MARRLVHWRLTERNDQDLARCIKLLDCVHDSIQATGMAGKAACIEALVQVHEVITGLLQEEMKIVRRFQDQQAAELETQRREEIA